MLAETFGHQFPPLNRGRTARWIECDLGHRGGHMLPSDVRYRPLAVRDRMSGSEVPLADVEPLVGQGADVRLRANA